MILAAGLGSRLKPFTDRIPKALIPLHGVSCIEFAMIAMREAGITRSLVNVHSHAEQMREFIRGVDSKRIRLVESDETELLLGSAGGLKKASSFFGPNPFFSMNADVFHAAPLAELARRHSELREAHGVTMTLILARGPILREQTGMYREIFTDDQSGLITGFGEKRSQVPFFTGTAIFEAEAFAGILEGVPSEFVPEVLEPAIRSRKAGFLYSDALWLDIGSPELWKKAELRVRSELATGGLPRPYSERLKTADPSFGGRFELGKNRIRLDDTVYEIQDSRDP
jgi:NDP-sugar pyrophosphorylase family protein